MRIHLVGAGGFAREVLDLMEALVALGADLEVAGLYADGHSHDTELGDRGYELTGPVSGLVSPGADDRFVIGFGQPAGRALVDQRLKALGWQTLNLVHPHATVGSRVILGEGAIVCAGARIGTNVRFGRHVQLNANSTVGHDARLADYVSINPLASIGGAATIQDRCLVGTGANIVERVTIGQDTVVGAGAVVLTDVDAGLTVAGVPARPLPAAHG